ncbi:hypothetical protein QYF36_008726 [Acer negundo]|nr:hypothetical protein QYF36_008726 [Acer negundo]
MNSQIGGALCLSSTIEVASDLTSDPEAKQLKKMLPRLRMVVKIGGVGSDWKCCWGWWSQKQMSVGLGGNIRYSDFGYELTFLEI